MKDIHTWFRNVRDLLYQLEGLDLGYPLGANEIFPPKEPQVVENGLRTADASDMDELRALYACCDGVSLPDVHVGYFVKSVTNLGVVNRSSEPLELAGSFAGKVLSIGSTGGGGLFVLRRLSGEVLHLAPGPLHNGVYNGFRGKVKRVSASLFGFLDCLMADLKAFVEADTSHSFIC